MNKVVHTRLCFSLFCTLFLFFCFILSGFAAEAEFVESGSSDISANELISRIRAASTIEFRNAIGYYVVRHYVKRDEKKDKQELEELRLSLEKSLKNRIEKDKKFGATTSAETIKQIREQNLITLEKREKIDNAPTITEVIRYTLEGNNYRTERVAVSNTVPLEKIRQDVQTGVIDFSRAHVLTWNGKITAEIILLDPSTMPIKDNVQSENRQDAMSSVSYEQIAQKPEFMDYSRDVKDIKFFDQFRKLGLPFSTASITIDKEQGTLLRIGNKNSVALMIETCVLPSKGYAVTYGRVKVGGAIMAEDYYRNFVKVENGSWLPTRITRTGYKVDQQGVPYVSTKREFLAIEPPRLNVNLPENTFDIANTKEFQSLKPLFANVSAYEPPKNEWSVVRLVFIVPGIILIVLGLLGKLRSFLKKRSSILFICVLCSLATASGCQKRDFSEKTDEYDIILTDSGAIVNYPSGIIPITAPVGMGIKRELTIKSEYANKIDAMTVSTTCGCSEAILSNTELSPGQFVTLDLFFKPEDVLLQNKIMVSVFIRHLDDHGRPFEVPVVYSNSDNLAGMQFDVSPPSISVDVTKSPDLNLKEQVVFRFGNKINSSDILVSTESSFVKPELINIDKKERVGNLDVIIDNPPIGQIGEKIRIAVQKDVNTFYKDIPITGHVLSSFYCEPNTITVEESKLGEHEIAEVNVFKRIPTLDFPNIEVTGNWSLDSTSVVNDNQLTIKVISNKKPDEDVGYGVIHFRNVQGDVISVPLVVTRASDDSTKNISQNVSEPQS